MSFTCKEPKLRFPEFRGEWVDKKLGDVVTSKSGKYNPEKEKISFKCIELEHLSSETGELLGYTDSINSGSMKNKFEKGDVLFGKLRPYLKKYLKAPFDGVCSSEIWVLKGLKISHNFLYRIIQTDSFIELANQSSGSKMPRADWNVVSNGIFAFPSKPEQEKIASFLTAVDAKIEQLTCKEKLLQKYKKSAMQKLFSQELRFTCNDGSEFPEWSYFQLNKILSESKKRNFDKKFNKNDVLSVSGVHGIVNQIELQGRSFAGASVDNYHIVEINDIVYTKSPLKANPYGIIKANMFKAGIVSTLYAVYKPHTNLNSRYLDYYFQIDINTNNYLRPLVHKGAKNDMKINNLHVLSGYISIPSLPEQTKIANFLSAIDEKLLHVKTQIEQTKQFKKALLQQMFV